MVWQMDKPAGLVPEDLRYEIFRVPMSANTNIEDSIIQSFTADGEFSVKSTYMFLMKKNFMLVSFGLGVVFGG